MSEFGGLWEQKPRQDQHALYNELVLGSATLLQLTFLGKSDPKFSREKLSIGTRKKVFKNTKKQIR